MGKFRTRNRAGAQPRWALVAVTAPTLLFLMVPTLVIVPMALTPRRYIEFPPSGLSLHSFTDLFADEQWGAAAGTSLQVAAIAVFGACLVGGTAAVALHGATFRGKGVVVGVIVAPMVVPLVVLGLGYYQFFASYNLIGTALGIGLAHSLIAMPYVFLAVQASLTGLDSALVRSAQSLGAGFPAVLRYVYLPVTAPGLMTGAVFAFAVSFDEAVISLFLQGPGATTLPVKMFNDIKFELSPKLAAVSTLLLLITTLILFAQISLVLARRAQTRRSLMRTGASSPEEPI